MINILTVLGLNDQRHLIFPEKNARYDVNSDRVIFTGRDGDKVILCAISKEAIQDHFDNVEKDILKIFQTHHEKIEHEADDDISLTILRVIIRYCCELKTEDELVYANRLTGSSFITSTSASSKPGKSASKSFQ